MINVTDVVSVLNRYPNGTRLRIVLEEGRIILEGVIDTIYETCNNLDDNDGRCVEYYACAFMITRVAKNFSTTKFEEDTLLELSKYNEPLQIELQDGTVIWEKQE